MPRRIREINLSYLCLYRKDFVSLFIIFLLAFLFFYRGFQGQIVWGFDTPKIIYPLTFLLDESFKNFKIPLWTPYIYFGFPIGADGQIPWYYPFNILLFFLPLHLTVTLLSFLHVFFAGLFTYLFARTINLNRISSIFASIAFMFNGFIIAHLQYFSHLYGYAYLPLILLLVELAIQRFRNIYFLLAGIMLGFQFLSGHPNIPIMSSIYVLFYSLIRLWNRKLLFVRGILTLSLAAFLIALPYLNLLFELIPLSIRANDVSGALNSSFSFFDFITFIFPHFFFINTGNWTISPTWHFWAYWGQIETTGYVGLITLLLIPFAFTKNNFKKTKVFLVLLIFSLVLALGGNTFVYKILLNFPIWKSITAPGRFLFLVDFSLIMLSAIGFNYICQNKIKKKIQLSLIYISLPFILHFLIQLSLLAIKTNPYEVYKFFMTKYSSLGYVQGIDNQEKFLSQVKSSLENQTSISLILVVISLLLILALLNGLKKVFIKYGILFLLVADLMLFAKYVNVWPNPNALFKTADENILYLEQKLNYSLDRIYTFSNVWSNLMPDQMILHHVQDGNGFASLPLQRFANWQVLAEDQWHKGNSKLFQMGSIKYVYDPAVESSLVKVNDSLPRAYVTSSFIKVSNTKDIFETLTRDSFNPKTVVIENFDLHFSNRDNALKFIPAAISTYNSDYVKILTDTSFDGFLVLTDSFYPGWHSFINGRETKIYQANYLFRAVFLPKGSNVVEFEYKPRFFSATIIISIGTFLLTLALIFKRSFIIQKILRW